MGRDPLIVCIDGCPLTQKLLKGIVSTAGYRFFGIQQAAMALPILIEQKPDFTLLYLVTPIASGYETCAQIRGVSQFKDIPVVILTGRDGLVDRLRATIVGRSDFIAKPVEAEKVLKGSTSVLHIYFLILMTSTHDEYSKKDALLE